MVADIVSGVSMEIQLVWYYNTKIMVSITDSNHFICFLIKT